MSEPLPEKRRPASKGFLVTALHLHNEGSARMKVDAEIGGRWYRMIEDSGGGVTSHITELWSDREFPLTQAEWLANEREEG